MSYPDCGWSSWETDERRAENRYREDWDPQGCQIGVLTKNTDRATGSAAKWNNQLWEMNDRLREDIQSVAKLYHKNDQLAEDVFVANLEVVDALQCFGVATERNRCAQMGSTEATKTAQVCLKGDHVRVQKLFKKKRRNR